MKELELMRNYEKLTDWHEMQGIAIRRAPCTLAFASVGGVAGAFRGGPVGALLGSVGGALAGFIVDQLLDQAFSKRKVRNYNRAVVIDNFHGS